MVNRKLIYFLVVFHILPAGSKATAHKFLSKLVNRTQWSNSPDIHYKSIEANLKCKYKYIAAVNELEPRFQARNQARFIDFGTNDTVESSEMEAPASKYSIFNFFSDNEEGEEEEKKTREEEEEEEEEEEDEEEEDEYEELEKEDDYGDEGDDDGIGSYFFGPEEEINSDILEDVHKRETSKGWTGGDDRRDHIIVRRRCKEMLQGTKGEELLKQYHRQRHRMHNLIFPLLLAYKLKFFTVIPLLLGSLVLLIGSTGIAGFFFALFAAALGIHAKKQHHQ